ncbi:MAG TPA: alpha/beta hydrolase [Dehalococcoidia bacterium]|nr:alpha/beta hydrolase [Dehalococcoidia bacterium]
MLKRTLIGGTLAAGLAAVAARRLGLREDLDWESVAKPGEVIAIGGYRVHYVDAGAGPAILLVHGFGGSTYQFRYQLPPLSAAHRVIAVDLKGFGYSERSATTGLSMSDQADMLAALLDRLGIEHATVVGHSMGGGVVQRFACAYPQLVDALVLASSINLAHHIPRFRAPSALLRPVLPVLAGVAASRLLSTSVYDSASLTPDVREEYLRPARIRGSMDGLLKMMRDRAHDHPVDVSQIRAPVMLLWGAHDRVVPLKVAHEIRAQIPHARLVVIERAGHLLFDERPEEVTRALLDFISEAVPVHMRAP